MADNAISPARPARGPDTSTADAAHARGWLRVTLRARLTVVATGLVALGLAAGAVLLLAALRQALFTGLDGTARQRASDIAALVDAGRLADPVPVVGGGAVVQVVDAQGRVRAASAGGDHLVPLLEPGPLAEARAGRAVGLDGARIGTSDSLRVVAVQAGPAGDRQTVLVAMSLAQLESSMRVVEIALLVGAPVLLAALAGLSWIVVGSALRPVAALRQGAEEITDSGGTRRLPVPAADDEVRRLAVTLNDMLVRLESASARQRVFVADAAHELRSPLAAMRTQLEVAICHPGGADWRETATDVLADTTRMARLVDDLLLLARLDEGTPPSRRAGLASPARPAGWLGSAGRPTDIVTVVDAVLDRPRAGERTVVRTGDPSVIVDGGADALTRVVANLVDNAMRHAQAKVVVDVRGPAKLSDQADQADPVSGARDSEPMAILTVSDDGPGIPPADRERVFARFTRLDQARSRDDGGSGLGLPIVRGLVESLGGSVQLADAAPGLRATVCLPARSPPRVIARGHADPGTTASP
jgi:signal transduction histidine kinase